MSKFTSFRVNGWAAIAIAVIVLAVSANMLGKATTAQENASALVGSVPLAEAEKAAPRAAPAPAQPATAVRVEASGKQRFGQMYAAPSVDEITGAKWLMICQRSTDSVVCATRGLHNTVLISFPNSLDTDLYGNLSVEVRYVMRDGTAVVRTYKGWRTNVAGGSGARFDDPAIIADVERNMSNAAHVVARAMSVSGEHTYARINVDPVDWIATRKQNRIVVISTEPAPAARSLTEATKGML